MTTRRRLLAAGLASIWPAASAYAQGTARIPRIGYLAVVDPAATPHLQAFRDGLRQLGFIEGKTIEIDYNWSPDTRVRLPQLAAGLVQKKVDVIVSWGTAASMAARDATSTIPIVVFSVTGPVGTGLVKSLAARVAMSPAPALPPSFAIQRCTSPRFSRAPGRRICRSNARPVLNSWSTRKPRVLSGSPYPTS